MNEWMFIPAFFFAWGIIKISSGQAFFIPLPMVTVREMLKLAKLKKGDVLYDLGSGDGRIVIEAAKHYGIHAVGIESGTLAYIISKLNVKLNRLSGRVKILNKDFFKADIGGASVVTIYLTPKTNRLLMPKLKKDLKKGTRIVSAAHEINAWKPLKKIKTGHFWTYLYKV